MDEEEFVETVRREAPLDSEDVAAAVADATLATLGERITDGEAEDLARNLPARFAEPLLEAEPGEAEPFPLEEFVTRVSDRAGIDESAVVASARAVAEAISNADGAELETAREQLPPAFDVLFEPGGPTTTEEFLETVSERAGLDDEDEARRATTATLRSLGEPLSAGEAEDLALYLPDELGDELLAADPSAESTTLDEFYGLVAQRANVKADEAETLARAVGSALADAASEREVEAARKQLSDPFGVVFEPPERANAEDPSS